MKRQEQYKDIYNLIKQGQNVRIENAKHGNATLYLVENERTGKKYIGWTHFGSSCNALNLKSLRWIINTLLEIPRGEAIEYHTTEYIYL